MNILFIGDIMGEPGRRVIMKRLSTLVAQHQVNVVIGNGENVAGGFGITPDLADDLFDLGFSALTLGNHAWDKKEIIPYINKEPRLLRPANYPEGVPGRGSLVIDVPGQDPVGVVQVMGRAFMPALDCPFRTAKREITALQKETNIIVVDMHAETTSEKMAMGYFLDGQVTAVLGTHTHVQTADAQLLPQGTAYMTDLGMTGPMHSVIGMKKEMVIDKFLTHMPRRFEVASGPARLCGALLKVDRSTGHALDIHAINATE